ncbi:hypothetical protein [Halobacillus yeomjeoni]|uniref:Aminodeoxychorismate lyase n=1 Tax=Halobacillus yeomjeoni TaxID=311194 RepID=A0A931HUV4_9BACI|nr:hypothetical protein [Halobacillus yeomjeoni]MBH0229879.1 hypothetical protein [Halobacillus yeomjeoni]
MRHWIRAFSLGILTATLLIGFTYYYFEEPHIIQTEAEPSKEELSISDMKETLKEEGYHVLDEEAFSELQQESTKTPPSATEEKSDQKEREENDPLEAKAYTIDIAYGTNAVQVSRALEKEGIIPDADKFITYLKENKYGQHILVGSVKVSSDMTQKELAEAISTK